MRRSHLDWAAIAILFAIPFDALDGRIARMTNTCSDFGKELDSLADVITFGVAPSLLALVWGFHFLPETAIRAAAAPDAGGRVHLLSVSALRSVAAGAVQHLARCAAAQSGTAGEEVLCGDADSGGGGTAGVDCPSLLRDSGAYWWISIPWLAAGGAGGIPDGEHVAVLVGQGDQLFAQPSVSGAGADGDRYVCDAPVLERGDVRAG
jgi:CDP-diacylglycerol--serine O-phosphatidyltransferase